MGRTICDEPGFRLSGEDCVRESIPECEGCHPAKCRDGLGRRALFLGLEFEKILVGKEVVIAQQPVAGIVELGDDLFAGKFVLWRRAYRKWLLLEIDYNYTPARLER